MALNKWNERDRFIEICIFLFQSDVSIFQSDVSMAKSPFDQGSIETAPLGTGIFCKMNKKQKYGFFFVIQNKREVLKYFSVKIEFAWTISSFASVERKNTLCTSPLHIHVKTCREGETVFLCLMRQKYSAIVSKIWLQKT